MCLCVWRGGGGGRERRRREIEEGGSYLQWNCNVIAHFPLN